LSNGDRAAHDEDRRGEAERVAGKSADANLKIVRGLGAVG
jgi:hypothetical protein